MRISDWSSDVCSSDLLRASQIAGQVDTAAALAIQRRQDFFDVVSEISNSTLRDFGHFDETTRDHFRATLVKLASLVAIGLLRSEEHTSELQSLMRISYAVFCLQKKNIHSNDTHYHIYS